MAKHWNPPSSAFPSGHWERMSAPVTLASLRQPGKYWVVSDAQLKRDLKGRTLKDVYRENRALRGVERSYQPKADAYGDYVVSGRHQHCVVGGLFGPRKGTMRDEYLAWCEARGHVPHPASIDPDHPANCHREKAPRRETIHPEPLQPYGFGRAIPEVREVA